MKSIYIFIFCLFIQLNTNAQTELIAFKSHSGNMANFSPQSNENLGLPPLSIDTIIILNDSTIVEISSYFGYPGAQCYKDTVLNHPLYQNKMDYEKLKGNYYDTSIVFINYDTLKIDNKKKTNSILPFFVKPPNSNNKLLIILSLLVLVSFSLFWQMGKQKLTV